MHRHDFSSTHAHLFSQRHDALRTGAIQVTVVLASLNEKPLLNCLFHFSAGDKEIVLAWTMSFTIIQ